MRAAGFFKTVGLASLAAAMVITAVPAQAQDERRNRGQASEARSARGNDANINQVRRRSQQIDTNSQRRAEQAAQRGDRAAERGTYRQAQRVDRSSERPAAQIDRNADRRAAQAAQDARRVGSGERGWTQSQRDRNLGEGRGVTYRNGGDRNTNRDQNWSNRNGNDWRGRNESRERAYNRWDNRSWRNDRRYDWYGYRASNRRAYSLGRYYAPYRNYSYRRVGIGFRLDNLFFGSRYWISDPWQYRLPAAYGPYRWVRYYDDVLLIDSYSGEVVDVIYDFFW